MKNRLTTTINELLFLVAISIYYIAVVLGETVIVEPGSVIASCCTYGRMLSYIIMVVVIIQLSIKEKHITIGCVLGIGLGLCAIFSKNNSCAYSFLILVAALSTDSRKIIKQVMIVQLIILVLAVSLSLAGVIENTVFHSEERIRYGLGFAWTTTSAMLFLFISFEYIYLRDNRITILELALIQALHVFFFIKTDSKMCMAIATMAVIIALFIKYHGRLATLIGRWYMKIMIVLPIIACVISIIISVSYSDNSTFWSGLNEFLNSRLRLSQDALKLYGITPFGQDIMWVGSSIFADNSLPYNYVDCSYIQIMLTYGVIFLLLVLALYTAILKYAKTEKKAYIGLVVSITLLLSITEPRLWNLTFNALPFMIVDVVKKGMKIAYNKTD